MALRVTPFFFSRRFAETDAKQRSITIAEVETPGNAASTDIIAKFELNSSKLNADPNELALYGDWGATSDVFTNHVGVLVDNGFDRFLDSTGLQKNDWSAGTLDTYYNTDGMTFSWIQRIEPAAGAVMLQYVQSDNEYIELSFVDTDTIRLSAKLGDGTDQFTDIEISDIKTNDGFFHHYLVSFNPDGDRIVRLYVNSVIAGSTSAVTGTATFGDEAVNIRRGIGFGSAFTLPTDNPSGDVDHCVILKGVFEPVIAEIEGAMMEDGIFMRYLINQMLYNP